MSKDTSDGYIEDLNHWDRDNPPFAVGMLVMCFSSAYRGEVQRIGMIAGSKWQEGGSHGFTGWLYHIKTGSGFEFWEYSCCLERLVMRSKRDRRLVWGKK